MTLAEILSDAKGLNDVCQALFISNTPHIEGDHTGNTHMVKKCEILVLKCVLCLSFWCDFHAKRDQGSAACLHLTEDGRA